MQETEKSTTGTTKSDSHGRVIYLETYGCQMNEYDTELVKAILAKGEYALTEQEMEADIIMLNTCAIRENAHRKVYGRVHEIHHKRKGHATHGTRDTKPVLIGILGCMSTNLRTELLENKNLKIDFIAGPDSYKRLPQLIEEALMDTRPTAHVTRKKIFDVTLSEFETYSDVYPQRAKGINAWVAIMRGCNNFCTFCVVPYTRGRERSRSVENVLDEVKRLADEGFKQVTLLGQNVNSYRHEEDSFADLMTEVSKVKGIERIRFTSPHPKDFPDEFIEVMANNPKVCNQIHLPLQAGNNRILDMMQRTYTKEEFLALADKIRTRIPEVALSTDIIVGFPTETDEEFADTVAVMKEVEFDSAFIFKYSQRKGTIAERKYPDDVPAAIKTERIVHLNEMQKEICLKKNEAHIGELQTILLENEGIHDNLKVYRGRTDGNKMVIIPYGSYQPGQMLEVRITGASPHALKGEYVSSN